MSETGDYCEDRGGPIPRVVSQGVPEGSRLLIQTGCHRELYVENLLTSLLEGVH